MQGIIVFYVNFPSLEPPSVVGPMLDLFREQNKSLIESIETEGGYKVMISPCFDESNRAEKIDFDKPHPRFVRMHIDVAELERRRQQRSQEFNTLQGATLP